MNENTNRHQSAYEWAIKAIYSSHSDLTKLNETELEYVTKLMSIKDGLVGLNDDNRGSRPNFGDLLAEIDERRKMFKSEQINALRAGIELSNAQLSELDPKKMWWRNTRSWIAIIFSAVAAVATVIMAIATFTQNSTPQVQAAGPMPQSDQSLER